MIVPFQYREFYDVPRCLIASYRGRLILLQSAFDARLDDYEPDYSAYLLPDLIEEAVLGKSWTFLENVSKIFIGRVPVNSVHFDPTKRKELDPACLADMVTVSE